jgi:undecaprenyl-diphosphatase
MYDWLWQLDLNTFYLINHKLVSAELTQFFQWITNLHKLTEFWIVVLPALTFWIYKKKKQAVFGLIHILMVAGLSDLVCYHGIKNLVHRDRPNNNPQVESILRLSYGPQSASFPSNHASTNFAMAFAVNKVVPQATTVVYLLAAAVAYSRPYLGVHYPSDILFGAVLGTLISFFYFLVLRQVQAFRQRRQN